MCWPSFLISKNLCFYNNFGNYHHSQERGAEKRGCRQNRSRHNPKLYCSSSGSYSKKSFFRVIPYRRNKLLTSTAPLVVPTNTASTALKPYGSLEGNILLLSLLNTPVEKNAHVKPPSPVQEQQLPSWGDTDYCGAPIPSGCFPSSIKKALWNSLKDFFNLKSCFLLSLNDPCGDLQLSGTVLRPIPLKSLEMFLQLVTINSLEFHSIILSSMNCFTPYCKTCQSTDI